MSNWWPVKWLPSIIGPIICYTNIGKYKDHKFFSCINICRVAMKLFEHEAFRLSVQTSSEGRGKC